MKFLFFHDSQGPTFLIFRDMRQNKGLFLLYAFSLIFLDLDKLSRIDWSFLRRFSLSKTIHGIFSIPIALNLTIHSYRHYGIFRNLVEMHHIVNHLIKWLSFCTMFVRARVRWSFVFNLSMAWGLNWSTPFHSIYMSPTFQAKQFSCKLDNLSITKKELYFLFLSTRLLNNILASPLQLSCRLKKRIVTKEKIND